MHASACQMVRIGRGVRAERNGSVTSLSCTLSYTVHDEFQVFLSREEVVGRQTQAGTRAGNQQGHRPVTSAHQHRPTTPHNGNQLNTPTRATTGYLTARALHVHQTRISRTHHFTKHATKVAPIDKQTPAPAAAKIGIASTCTQIGIRAAGVTPRRLSVGWLFMARRRRRTLLPESHYNSSHSVLMCSPQATYIYIPYFACLQCMHGAQPRQPVASYHDQKAEACNAQLPGEDHSALDKRGAIP